MTHSQFSTALVAAGLHPSIPPEHRIFEPLIGSWDLDITWYDQAGHLSRSMRGEWHFAPVLEGRAIQDVWIAPPRSERTASSDGYEYGTSLRFYDPSIAAWRSTWIGPMRTFVKQFIARRLAATIVLESTDAEQRLRWTFSDLAPDSFKWTNEEEGPEGWRVQQRFVARRMPG